MITTDWGNYEETIIVMRIEGHWQTVDFDIHLAYLQQMVKSKSHPLCLMFDARLAAPVPAAIVKRINAQLTDKQSQLERIVAIITEQQKHTLALISNFYPALVTEVVVVDTVDDAYQLILAIA